MLNAHTHLYSGLAPLGLPAPEPPPDNFVQILERLWWRLDRALDADSLRASVRYYVAHALLLGTTALVDHHESPEFIEGSLDVIADECQALGMRALLTYGATERNGGRAEAQRGLEECRRFITTNRRPLIRGVVGLHATFTVSDDTIRAAGELCRSLNVPLHIHLAEDGADVLDARQRGYPGPLERLIALDALPAGSLLAHGVHLTPEQVSLAQGRGAWLIQNPRSNKGNRVGYARHLADHPLTALGTDGYPSALDDEAAVLREEAVAHGQAREVAALRLGGNARLKPALFGAGADTDHVYAGPDGRLDSTIAGAAVVAQGRLMTGNIDDIDAHARAGADRLWARMRALPA